MRTRSGLFRLVGLVAIAPLLLAPSLAGPAAAQSSPPLPPLAPAPGATTAADPPARVGRLALITGTVSFHAAADTEWSPASVNDPVAAGDSFWTQPDAEADLELGGTRIDMAGITEADLNTLDDSGTNATLPQGEVYIRVRALMPNETVTLETPRGTVTIAAPGQYDVVAGDTADPTVVTVVTGAAQVSGTNLSLNLGPGQAATLTGTDSFQGGVGPATPDAFLSAMLAREHALAPQPGAATPPPAIAELPGGEDLATAGTWATAPDYGEVWYPPVPAGWVPYRDGHWAYVAPWGWTWIDAAPWGFAPFHYGRWAHIGDRWGWVPGAERSAVARPVYAPALVTFFGVGAPGTGAGAAIGGSVGWCPLAPGEVYHPWYHASERYVRAVNVHVTNVTNIIQVNNVTINHYHNAHFATVVPAAALAGSHPVAREARAVSAHELAAAHPVVDREPLRPTAGTAGVTQAVARQLHIETPRGAPAPRVAPGPAVHPAAQTQAGRTRVVPLRPPVNPVAARPGQPISHPAEAPHGAMPPVPTHPAQAVVRPGPAGHPIEPALRPGEHAPPAGEHPAAARPGQPIEHPAEAPHAPALPAHPTPAVVHPAPAGHPAEPARRPEGPAPPAAGHPAAARPAAPVEHPAEAPHAPAPPATAHPTPAVVRPAPAEHPAEQARRPEEHAPPAAGHPAAARPAAPVEHPAEAPHAPASPVPAHPAAAVVRPAPAEHPAAPARRPEEHAPPAAGHPAAARPAPPIAHPTEVPRAPVPPAPHPVPPAPHPAEAPHPVPPAPHPAEAPHRAAPPEPHPAPPHPAQEAHPAAVAHPAPQAHPAPPPRPEEQKPEEKKPGQP